MQTPRILSPAELEEINLWRKRRRKAVFLLCVSILVLLGGTIYLSRL